MRFSLAVRRRAVSWIGLLLLATPIWFALPTSLRTRVAPTVYAATFTVTNTNDDGPGSLRNAILSSNLNMGASANVIAINLPVPGSRRITLLSALPVITSPVTFPSLVGGGAPVELNGSSAGTGVDGLVVAAGHSTIRGLAIVGFSGTGIRLRDNGGNSVNSNWIGLDATATSVQGNLIGISIESSSTTNTIEQNYVAGNATDGIRVASTGNTIDNNRIGVGSQTNFGFGNLGNGIAVTGSGNLIYSNSILGSHGAGIRFQSGSGNSFFNNTIAESSLSGVQIDDGATRVDMSQNSIHSNGGLGIDLGPAGVTPNDAGDGDTGANTLQNFPVLTSATTPSVGVSSPATVTGTLNSTPNTTFRIALYSNFECDPSGNGEGRNYRGDFATALVTTGNDGNANFTIPNVPADPGNFLTATATDPVGNTSEFSQCIQVDSPGFLGFKQFDFTVNENDGSVAITVNRSRGSIGTVTVNYASRDGSATKGSDYTATSGTLSFAPGEISKTFVVPILDDSLVEGTESLDLQLSNPTNGSALIRQEARVVIFENESPPPPTIFAITFEGSLVSFNSEAPGVLLSRVPITGLQFNEAIFSIDFRPLNGRLYGLGSTGRLYTIDKNTGAATVVGAGPFNPGAFAFQFDPVADRIRAVSTGQKNLRINPTTGQVVAVDGALAFAAGDLNFGKTPNIRVLTNTNSFTGATSTTTYGIDFEGGISPFSVLTVGSVGGSPVSPNTGQLFTKSQFFATAFSKTSLDRVPEGNNGDARSAAPEHVDKNLGGFDIADDGTGFIIIADAEESLNFVRKIFVAVSDEDIPVDLNEEIRSIAIVPSSRLQLSSDFYSVNENAASATITVRRTGDSSVVASVNYETNNGTASVGQDYSATSGTLNFAAGETTKTFVVPLIDDAMIEGVESVNLTLSNVSAGSVTGPRNTATIAIMDEPTEPGTTPIDNADFFVRQHYSDFLNRQPDAGGLAFWTNQITQCFNDPACINERRIGASAAFFIENEFQRTGFFIYRFYQAGLGRRPAYTEFNTDRGQVVGGANLENGQQTFATEFVQRQAFLQKYPLTMDGPSFVDALLITAGQASGLPDLSTRRDSLIAQYNLGANQTDSRVRVVRALIDDSAFSAALYNPAFVLMQYYGYLRRPADQNGYNFWLDHLNNRNPNNYRAMVCAFITSLEYQRRFSTITTRSNQDCAQ